MQPRRKGGRQKAEAAAADAEAAARRADEPYRLATLHGLSPRRGSTLHHASNTKKEYHCLAYIHTHTPTHTHTHTHTHSITAYTRSQGTRIVWDDGDGWFLVKSHENAPHSRAEVLRDISIRQFRAKSAMDLLIRPSSRSTHPVTCSTDSPSNIRAAITESESIESLAGSKFIANPRLRNSLRSSRG